MHDPGRRVGSLLVTTHESRHRRVKNVPFSRLPTLLQNAA